FKAVNDALGHAAGDRLLQEVAVRLRGALRAEAVVARQGGDEFVVVLPELGEAGEAARVAERLLAALGRPHRLEGRAVRVSASIGIALYPDDAGEAAGLLRRAAGAMYRGKGGGGGRCRFAAAETKARFSVRAALKRR